MVEDNRLRHLQTQFVGLHLTALGFVTLWFHQYEIRVTGLALSEVVGWILVLFGFFVTVVAYSVERL